VVQVMASVTATHELILVANSQGVLAGDVRPLVRMNVTVLVEQNGRREQGYAGCGGRYTLDELVAEDRPLSLAREAVRQFGPLNVMLSFGNRFQIGSNRPVMM